MRLPFLLLLVGAFACGGREPVARDESGFLRVGAPREQASRAISHFERRGFTLARRLDRQDASGIYLVRPETGDSIVRIFSARGVVLAVDAPSATHSRSAVSIEDLPLSGGSGNHFLVAARNDALEETCLAVLEVTVDGNLRELLLSLPDLGQDICLVPSDEGLVLEISLRRYSPGSIPELRLPIRIGRQLEIVDREVLLASLLRREVSNADASGLAARKLENAFVMAMQDNLQSAIFELERALPGTAPHANDALQRMIDRLRLLREAQVEAEESREEELMRRLDEASGENEEQQRRSLNLPI